MDRSKPPAIVIPATRGHGKSTSILVKVAEAFLAEPGKEHKFIFERRTNGKRKN